MKDKKKPKIITYDETDMAIIAALTKGMQNYQSRELNPSEQKAEDYTRALKKTRKSRANHQD